MAIRGDRFKFTKQNVDGSPNVGGVYALYISDELVYIGRALGVTTTIRSRLQDHLAGREGATSRATSYRREACRNPKTREKELLEEYEALHGKLPRYNERVG
jgi:hypothetical protein